MSIRLIVVFSFISCAIGGFPAARTIFRDWKTHDTVFRSDLVNILTEAWMFEKEYDLVGFIIGSRHEDVYPASSSRASGYEEHISVHLVKHNGTYGAPRHLVGSGCFQGLKEYGSTIYIPLLDLEGVAPPQVLPVSLEHTLYYLEISFLSGTSGWYPYYHERDLTFFGAVSSETVGSGIVIGIEYSKPSAEPNDDKLVFENQ